MLAQLEVVYRGTVLIIEDVPSWAELLATLVEEEGFRSVKAETAAEGMDRFVEHQPSVVLLDWVLPDAPGIELCRRLRSIDPLVTIVFISGRADEASMVRGLDAGADDFVVKPVQHGELIARIEAHMRKLAAATEHSRHAPAAAGQVERLPADGQVVHLGDVEIDLAAREVFVEGRPVALGRLEYGLLELLARNAGQAISRDLIMERVYGFDAEVPSDRVDILVRRLRIKLGDGPGRAGQIVAVHGFGYRLERRRADRQMVSDRVIQAFD
jgi:two-component system response regulator RegX3